MKIFLSEVDNFLLRAELSTDIALENPKSNVDDFRSLILSWILDIEELGKNNKIKLILVGEMFGEFTGLNKPKSQSLFLYSRKNKIKLENSGKIKVKSNISKDILLFPIDKLYFFNDVGISFISCCNSTVNVL